MDNAQTQSMVAYEDGPKEVNNKRGMPSSEKQFGKGNKMPQDHHSSSKKNMKEMSHGRHKEHR